MSVTSKTHKVWVMLASGKMYTLEFASHEIARQNFHWIFAIQGQEKVVKIITPDYIHGFYGKNIDAVTME